MALKGALRGMSELDVLFAAYAGIALLVLGVLAYNFVEAWFAPRCASIGDVGLFAWCLPIGFEGPFADIWSNRSVSNARTSATLNLAIMVCAFASALYFAMRGHGCARAIAYCCGLAVLLILLMKSLLLNDFS
jgi:hypothetical protein